ncbi:polyprenyl synthetase family protein [Streptomyces sp. NPDC051555]|uniref:polyprenyl synthetase family protein n=1 Tax=Streptomyces sp. NPDC051555 TaxID=3365657 RepID=UPI0037951805
MRHRHDTRTPHPGPRPQLDLHQLKTAAEDVLTDFLAHKSREAADGSRLPNLGRPLQEFLAAGGKRIRPVLAMVGWHAAGAHGSQQTACHLAASLELFHAFALIHDDVMDHSDTRRGHPTIHRSQAAQRGGSASSADRFGQGAAILIGDLALCWSDELLHTGLPAPLQLSAVLPLLDAMRTEVTLGQYLDLAGNRHSIDVDAALTVIRYKTAKYTIERPLQLGAALAGAPQPVLDALSAYAIPLGEAFQLRDDLLGVFGNPHTTGKPALDDLREGKATVLIALAYRHASREQADQLRHLIGCPDLNEVQARAARRIIRATGADHTVENMITERYDQAMASLDRARFEPAAIQALRSLADSAVKRQT